MGQVVSVNSRFSVCWYLLKKVLLAKDHPVACETLVGELAAAVRALEAPRVPRAFQHLEDEPVQDELVAATALGDAGWNRHNHRSDRYSTNNVRLGEELQTKVVKSEYK